jgi:hypothetical protein
MLRGDDESSEVHDIVLDGVYGNDTCIDTTSSLRSRHGGTLRRSRPNWRFPADYASPPSRRIVRVRVS